MTTTQILSSASIPDAMYVPPYKRYQSETIRRIHVERERTLCRVATTLSCLSTGMINAIASLTEPPSGLYSTSYAVVPLFSSCFLYPITMVANGVVSEVDPTGGYG